MNTNKRFSLIVMATLMLGLGLQETFLFGMRTEESTVNNITPTEPTSLKYYVKNEPLIDTIMRHATLASGLFELLALGYMITANTNKYVNDKNLQAGLLTALTTVSLYNFLLEYKFPRSKIDTKNEDESCEQYEINTDKNLSSIVNSAWSKKLIFYAANNASRLKRHNMIAPVSYYAGLACMPSFFAMYNPLFAMYPIDTITTLTLGLFTTLSATALINYIYVSVNAPFNFFEATPKSYLLKTEITRIQQELAQAKKRRSWLKFYQESDEEKNCHQQLMHIQKTLLAEEKQFNEQINKTIDTAKETYWPSILIEKVQELGYSNT